MSKIDAKKLTHRVARKLIKDQQKLRVIALEWDKKDVPSGSSQLLSHPDKL
jgi:hypothetical protein